MKNKFKKILSAALAVLVVLSGCNSDAEEPEGSVFSTPYTEISDSDIAVTTAARQTEAETEAATEAETQTEAQTVPKTETRTEAQTAVQTTAKTEAKTEAQTAAASQITAQTPAQTETVRDQPSELLSQMSLEEKIGQVILVRYSDNAPELSAKYHFGGYTLYAKDFKNETEESIKQKLSTISSASSIPPFIAADEEGGDVIRISRYSQFSNEPLPPLSSAAAGDVDAFAEKTAEILKKAGVNLNLAPVADVAESESDYIYDRTCKLGYSETGRVIAKLVSGLNLRGVMSCLKHFPGYGSNVDTHTGIAVDNRSKAEFEAKDLIPFKAGINAGVPMVMVNHNIVTAYNANKPASLAPEVHSALRGLGFDGIIVTDDLGMQAILLYTDNPYADAFLAGNDLLCTSDGIACYNSLYNSVLSGRITEKRLDESVYRILRAKLRYGIVG